jgi:hypothetical protein
MAIGDVIRIGSDFARSGDQETNEDRLFDVSKTSHKGTSDLSFFSLRRGGFSDLFCLMPAITIENLWWRLSVSATSIGLPRFVDELRMRTGNPG